MEHYRKTSHSVYAIKLHLVWITKYRKPVLYGDVAVRLRELIREICKAKERSRGSCWANIDDFPSNFGVGICGLAGIFQRAAETLQQMMSSLNTLLCRISKSEPAMATFRLKNDS